MGITSGIGLISGINTESLISQLTAASRRPIQIIQQRQSVLNTKVQAYQVLSSKLGELRDQLKNLMEPEDFAFRSASTSNNDILGISADKTATVGSYGIKVLQVAQAHRLASHGISELDSPIAAADGVVTIQVGSNGAVRNYNVSATTTLAELRDSINRDTSSEVQASIVNDGSPTNPYRLVLTAKKTGSANAIRILNNDTSLDLASKSIEAATAAPENAFDGSVTSSGAYTGVGTTNIVAKIVEAGEVDGAAKFVVSLDGGVTFGETTYTAQSSAQDISGGKGVQIAFAAGTSNFAVNDRFSIDAFDPVLSQAQDAVISVDGVQISRSDNTFRDVVAGVTFTAKAPSSTTITASVTSETGLLTAEVIKFQSAYNGIVSAMRELSAYDQKSKVAQPLFGDSALRGIQRSLATLVTDPVVGAGTKYNTLASLGMKLQADGTLGYDMAKMNEALESDPSSIMRIFGRIAESTSSQVKVAKIGEKTVAGTYEVSITSAASRAQIDGNQTLRAEGLAEAEMLTFTHGGKTFVVSLAAGDTLDAVISKLNAEFSTQGASLEAVDFNGALRLQTKEYGSAAAFNIMSDRAGDVDSQLGIGNITRTDNGSDVVALINNSIITGSGQNLKGAVGTSAEGLELLVTASMPVTSTIRITSGLADQMLRRIEEYIDSEDGIIKTRQDGLNSTITNLDERITNMEARTTREAARMRRQFAAMEQQLSKLQGLGDYVTQQISNLQSIKNS